MKDNLEKFITDNREAFDQDIPSPKIWERIDQQIVAPPKNRRVMMWKIAGVAASVAILIGFGALLGANYSDSSSLAITDERSLSPELQEMENYYQKQIEKKKARLVGLDYEGSVIEDLQQLDAFFKELKEELEVSPKGAEERIIEAMINNYQIRIDILERVLNHLESPNQEINKSKDDEATSI